MAKGQTRQISPQVIQGMTLGTLLKVLARNGYLVDPECLCRLAHLARISVLTEMFPKAQFLHIVKNPGVPGGSRRIRMCLMATHTRKDLEKVVEECGRVGRELGIIR